MGFFDSLLAQLLQNASREIADAVFPPLCALCGAPEPGDGLGCDEHRLPLRPPGPRCRRCASALPPAIADGERCADCRLDPPSFEAAIALGDYRAQPALRDWILALKHGGRRDLARTLGRALAARFAEDRPRRADPSLGPPILVPVPLHWTRRLERGYDQARLVAEALAAAPTEEERLEVVPVLSRSRATAVQGSIGAPSRGANVAGAFGPRRLFRSGARKVSGRDAWLVDDVVTSGATASECSRALKRLGAARVGLLALARA